MKSPHKINFVNTSKYAKKFTELLEYDADKAYFLQGTWGSGKTN